jgi:hypothetical protein
MSKKNKQQFKQPAPSQIPVIPKAASIGVELELVEEVKQTFSASHLGDPTIDESQPMASALDIRKTWARVKEMNDDLKEKASQSSAKWKEMQDLEDKNKELKAELEKKLTKAIQLESELLAGQLTGSISETYEKLRETQGRIFEYTQMQINKLGDFHTEKLAEYLRDHKIAVSNQVERDILQRQIKRLEAEKRDAEDSTAERISANFNEQISALKAENDALKRRLQNVETEYHQLKQFVTAVRSAFKQDDPLQMIKEFQHIQKLLKEKESQLAERPERFEVETFKKQVDQLKYENNQLQKKFSENELLKLKEQLAGRDTTLIMMKNLEKELLSALSRETGLLALNDKLNRSINELAGKTSDKKAAFEFAIKCDNDREGLQKNHLASKTKYPKDLAELAAYLQYKMFKQGFNYSLEVVRTFMAGLAMSPISILQGISGTGKTSLPREFIKALVGDPAYINDGKEMRSPYAVCAVQSGWRENTDLIGYYNSFENKYNETDFFKALYLANQPKYQDTLFFIILDEMNLSRPEHYFADFLSLLEQAENEWYVSIPKTPEEALPNSLLKGKLRIPQNVRFIGTANHDETTLEFAPKTYDRSNVMEMPRNKSIGLAENSTFQAAQYNVTYSWIHGEFSKAIPKHGLAFKQFQTFLHNPELITLLEKKGIGIGNRLENQGRKFIAAYLESGAHPKVDLGAAADHLITSRIFRSLKNKYEFDKPTMTQFMDDYVQLFEKSFDQYFPANGVSLLEAEISKKTS